MSISIARTQRDTWAVYEGTPMAHLLGEIAFRNDAWLIEGDQNVRRFATMFDAVKGLAGDLADGPLKWHLLAKGDEILEVMANSTELNQIMTDGSWILVASESSLDKLSKYVALRRENSN